MNIISPSAPIRKNSLETSSLETEFLYGESVEVLKVNSTWIYCKSLIDNYFGWVKKKSFRTFENSNSSCNY